ncbi:MarR family winged helix-turn-helix transcriptional regulator [Nafulsella turpanensis]|uniref:MarR family winged helix-turn-helix transcriptional regulator n=1 Tax=Nafulsella turpanensis TaxID=1265690 RepID=UPI00034AE5FF|nr:MarR family transcriptional regulator [Nafulsella turpanensis]
MRIEEEIHQNKFRNEYQKAAINLIYTHNWLTTRLKNFLAEHEITLQQYNVLRILRGQFPDSISTSAIRERMLDRSSDASRIVERIHKQGLVEKKTSMADKRLVDVKISNKGLKLLEKIDAVTEDLDRILGNLELEEAVELNRLLDKVRSKEEEQ